MGALAEKMLDILRQHGGWMTRKELAHELGRPRDYFVAYDTSIIEELVEAGLVERDDRLVGAVKTVKYYRVKGE